MKICHVQGIGVCLLVLTVTPVDYKPLFQDPNK